jgi:hypothetical protein
MGTIKVGQKNPKTVEMGGFTVAPANNGATKESKLSAEEKARIVKNIMALPKDQIVPALRKNGFNDIADITEAEMKKADEEAAKEEAREKRLAEIMAMPVEEQLPLLLAEGYEDEAKELSELLAAEQNVGQEKTDEGTGEDNQGTEVPADGTTSELNDEGAGEAPETPESGEAPADAAPAEEPEKKKRGTTTKKTTSKK